MTDKDELRLRWKRASERFMRYMCRDKKDMCKALELFNDLSDAREEYYEALYGPRAKYGMISTIAKELLSYRI